MKSTVRAFCLSIDSNTTTTLTFQKVIVMERFSPNFRKRLDRFYYE